MRQIFNKKQLIVMWSIALFICAFFIRTSISHKLSTSGAWWMGGGYWYWDINWERLLIYPIIIIGVMLVITLGKRQLPGKEK